jgi:hypothetical protein
MSLRDELRKFLINLDMAIKFNSHPLLLPVFPSFLDLLSQDSRVNSIVDLKMKNGEGRKIKVHVEKEFSVGE